MNKINKIKYYNKIYYIYIKMNYKPQSINNIEKDYDEFLITLDSSKRDGGSLVAPSFKININGMVGKPEIYDTNKIYLVPLFFYAKAKHNEAGPLPNHETQYFEIRCDQVVAMNHISKDYSQNVILRGFMVQGYTTNQAILKYENLDNVNNKYLKIDPQILNNNEFIIEIYDIANQRIDLSQNAADVDKTFKLEFKIVLFKKDMEIKRIE